MPQCLYCPSPNPANMAPLKSGQETAIFKVLVSPTGTVDALQPVSVSGNSLDEQAFNDIKTWRFRPATDPDGKPIAIVVPVEVTFRLY